MQKKFQQKTQQEWIFLSELKAVHVVMETLASFIFNAIRLKGTFLGPEPKAVAVRSLRLFLHKYDYESSKGYYEFLISLTIDNVL